MYKRIVIIGYKAGSRSVRALKEKLREVQQLPVLVVRRDSTKYQPRYTDYIINWGCQDDWNFITLEDFTGHEKAVNKLEFFKTIQGYNEATPAAQVNIPAWSADAGVALGFKGTVVCRTILNGHSGAGIKLVDLPLAPEYNGALPAAPLYVEYKKKRHEYRVHVYNGSVIDVAQKKKKVGAETLDTKIRNHKNGWVYARENITIPGDLFQQAQLTMEATKLKFGAVDIIWNEKENKSYVLEVNTAPGIEGTTVTKYVEAILKEIKNAV